MIQIISWLNVLNIDNIVIRELFPNHYKYLAHLLIKHIYGDQEDTIFNILYNNTLWTSTDSVSCHLQKKNKNKFD